MPHVLVVDDNPLTLHFFVDALAAIDIDGIAAGSGTVAIELAVQRRFDLLLIDARMPAPDGTQTLRAIRTARGASATTPAIATSAEHGLCEARLLEAGFHEVMRKPVALDALHACIARHLRMPECGIEHRATCSTLLDDTRALAAAGDSATIVSALRGLLAIELDALPAELASMAAAHDRVAMRDRLHRLAASAGFCGAVDLAHAIDRLQGRIAIDGAHTGDALREFDTICRATRLATSAARDGAQRGC